MNFFTNRVLFITIVVACTISFSLAWDNEDLELFDLVEEIEGNFYDLLGVANTASSSEIRKAYRRQSLILHPDKNKEDTEEKFRQLVAVAEVLKNADMRQRYDHILENGLPDWRQPVFYYRRVHKMGLLELTALLFLILSIGHYLVLWSMYWERLLDLESILPKRKKDKKSKRSNRQPAEGEDTEPARDLDDPFQPVKPRLTDALPCKLFRLIITSIISTPAAFVSVRAEIDSWRERRKLLREAEMELEESEEEEEGEGRPKVKKRRRVVDMSVYDYEPSTREPVTYTPVGVATEESDSRPFTKSRDWTQDDVTKLTRVMVRFPGGTTDRWDKIADEMERPLSEVIKKAKEIKSGGFVVSVQASSQGITGAVQHTVSSKTGRTFGDDIITTTLSPSTPAPPPPCQDVVEALSSETQKENNARKRHKNVKQNKTADRTSLISADNEEMAQLDPSAEMQGNGTDEVSWSQRQQKIFEKALSIYPKGTAERWEKVAEAVPGKTKEDCVLRYKELVEAVRRKKQTNVQQLQSS